MDSLEKGLVRRVELEQRELSEDDRRYSKTLKGVGRSFKSARSLSPFSCSFPVVLSCILIGTILILDMNQYILGNVNCRTNIFSFQLVYPSTTGAQMVTDTLFEPVLFSNHTTDGLAKQTRDHDGQDPQEVAVKRQLALLGVPVAGKVDSIRAQPNEMLDMNGTTQSYSARESNVKSNLANDTFSEEVPNWENLDRSIFSYADDSRIDRSDSFYKQFIQTRTELINQAEVDDHPHVEGGSQLHLESDSTYSEGGSYTTTSSDELADVEETGAAENLFLEQSSAVPPPECDIFYGHWVYDETYPLYAPSSCPFVDEGFNCTNNGRLDTEYLKWRWQPYDCDLPRFNGTDMLERLRNKRLTFVGDSLGRNQWESMLCMLYHAAPNKSRVFEVNGELISKHQNYLAFQYSDYNATVEFHRAPFLVHQGHKPADAPSFVKSTLHLDWIDSSAKKWNRSQLLIFNTGHWWTYAKTLRGHCYFVKGGQVVDMEILEAFEEGMRTWARFVDENIDAKKTRVFFRSFSPTHFRGGQWNTGGQCNVETSPYTNRTKDDVYHPPTEKVRIAEGIISAMKTPITLLNATELTDYRRDGHPSKWTQTAGTYGAGVNGSRYQDCSHWCLPGVPDTWNELLYASLLMHPDRHYDLSSRSHRSTRQHKKRSVRHVIQKAQSRKKLKAGA